MICSKISDLLGIACHPLNEDGSVAMIDTSFAFEDGDPIPVFVERVGNRVRFFDDGGVIMHFHGRGLSVASAKKTKFIKSAAEAHSVSLSDMGELEVWSAYTAAPEAFARYMCAMISLVGWERGQIGVATDTSLLVDEVAQCLRAWKPHAEIKPEPEYVGISGQVYKLDFDVDGEAIVAINPHPNSVSSAVKKLLDIKSSPLNQNIKLLAVIDDRYDGKAARREGLIMDALATVWPMTKLEETARLSKTSH